MHIQGSLRTFAYTGGKYFWSNYYIFSNFRTTPPSKPMLDAVTPLVVGSPWQHLPRLEITVTAVLLSRWSGTARALDCSAHGWLILLKSYRGNWTSCWRSRPTHCYCCKVADGSCQHINIPVSSHKCSLSSIVVMQQDSPQSRCLSPLLSLLTGLGTPVGSALGLPSSTVVGLMSRPKTPAVLGR